MPNKVTVTKISITKELETPACQWCGGKDGPTGVIHSSKN